MKCQNCKIIVDAKFEFAIKSNNCPACGKHIMAADKLVAYVSLKELLSSNFSNIDVEKIVSLIVANFELKQIFQDSLQNIAEDNIVEVTEDEQLAKDADSEYKIKKRAEAKNILKKMRDEALAKALDDQGIGFNESVLIDEGAEMHEIVNKEKQRQSQDIVTSGFGGKNSFSRSG